MSTQQDFRTKDNPHGLLRNPLSNDIAMQVWQSHYNKKTDCYELKVSWWNIGRSHEPFEMGVTQDLNIAREKYKQWVPYSSVFHLKLDTEIADKKTIAKWRQAWYEREGYKHDILTRNGTEQSLRGDVRAGSRADQSPKKD